MCVEKWTESSPDIKDRKCNKNGEPEILEDSVKFSLPAGKTKRSENRCKCEKTKTNENLLKDSVARSGLD